ncbi:nucleoprotein [Khasan virus]|nr:nucleoprotein [Khasan virus]
MMAIRAPIDFVLELASEPWDADNVASLVELYAYQGFDPTVIQQEIVRKATLGKRDWKADVRNMIILNVTRGNKLDKMAAKMTDKAKDALKDLRRIYELKDSKPGAKDITLARVANVHGASTCSMLRLVPESLPVPHSHMNTLSQGYPVSMMHTSFGGLINPNAPGAQDVTDAHKLYLVEFSRVINRAGGKSVGEIVESFRTPLASAIGSQFLKDPQKNAILKNLGIYDENMHISEKVVAAAETFRRMAM